LAGAALKFALATSGWDDPARSQSGKGVTMPNLFLPKAARLKAARLAAALLLAAAGLIGLGTLVGLAVPQYTVSQKGREFNPLQIAIRRGETVLVVNDDLDLRHHVYVDTDKFRFDAVDQEPGSKTPITFPVAGTFDVLCAIHPKMKLVVEVK
jgi:plastocyanin